MKNKKVDLEIGLVKEEEIAKLAKIFAESFDEAYPEPQDKWTEKGALRHLRNLFEAQPDLFFVARVAGKPVGAVWGEARYLNDGGIEGKDLVDIEIFVDEDHRNLGIGKKLFKKLLAQGVKKYQIRGLELLVYKKTPFPMKWYKELGMQKTDWLLLEGKAKKVLKNLEK